MTERIDTSAARATGNEAEFEREQRITGPAAGIGGTDAGGDRRTHEREEVREAEARRADELSGEPAAANAAARQASDQAGESGRA